MPNHVEPTEELMQHLWEAQLRCVKETCEQALERRSTGDDGHDYMNAALDLMQTMQMLWYDDILTGTGSLNALLNTPLPQYDHSKPYTHAGVPDNPEFYKALEEFQMTHGFCHLFELATDGVANEFYELNCLALPKEEA